MKITNKLSINHSNLESAFISFLVKDWTDFINDDDYHNFLKRYKDHYYFSKKYNDYKFVKQLSLESSNLKNDKPKKEGVDLTIRIVLDTVTFICVILFSGQCS